MKKLKKAIGRTVDNKYLQSLLVMVFLIPLIATIGQYISSGFIFDKPPVSLLYWPGSDKSLKVYIPVWLSFGAMAASYVYGIYFMCRRKTFVKVTLMAFASLYLAQGFGNIINYVIGIKEMQNINSMEFSGLINRMIFASWYNPLWEEVFFTGIPLALFITLTKNRSEKIKFIGKMIYFIVPSIICSIYHIPNHGQARIIDTFLIHVMFEYIAIRFSFFANLVMHYIFDAMIVTSLYKVNNVSYEEIKWLSDNSALLNTIFSILMVIIFCTIIGLIIRNCIKQKYKNVIQSTI